MSTTAAAFDAPTSVPRNSPTRVATASFIGTAIEFYDFYVYATAAALVIGPVFFPQGAGMAQTLSAFITFGIAFLARPLGSLLFGLPFLTTDFRRAEEPSIQLHHQRKGVQT